VSPQTAHPGPAQPLSRDESSEPPSCGPPSAPVVSTRSSIAHPVTVNQAKTKIARQPAPSTRAAPPSFRERARLTGHRPWCAGLRRRRRRPARRRARPTRRRSIEPRQGIVCADFGSSKDPRGARPCAGEGAAVWASERRLVEDAPDAHLSSSTTPPFEAIPSRVAQPQPVKRLYHSTRSRSLDTA